MGDDVRKALGLLLALVAAATGGPPAFAGDSKGEMLEAARDVVARAGLDCTVVDANRIQAERPARGGRRRGGVGRGGMGGGMSDGPAEGGMSGPGTSAEGRSEPLGYEVACRDGLCFVVLNAGQRHGPGRRRHAGDSREDASSRPPPDYLNCLEADAAADRLGPTVRCRLQANRDRVGPVQALVSRAGLDCSVNRVRGLGHTEKQSFFELACIKARGAPPKLSDTGFVLVTSRTVSAAGELSAFPCFDAQANPGLRCSLTNVGPIVEALHRTLSKSEPDCVATSSASSGSPSMAAGCLKSPAATAPATFCVSATTAPRVPPSRARTRPHRGSVAWRRRRRSPDRWL
jgi:hypothetical protein